ncbi:hypothetical protein J641_1711 [Acinetobacter baumannii 1188188]|nr:hypothetical protein ACIN5109_1348 [Acinetobacter baumannii OIFC109]EXH11789.1 hypothetical protein J641_1711 [Acinetobacter baumannii 1188188]EXH17447.1 hypothetical protein J636_2638 [Acinetobacter baumannii 1271213]EZI43903.1 hypothetical protein K037_1988 [Acinetobacter baumannii 42057_6]KCX11867.1 hypothetical protein J990_1736 [Acinetobacter baumannii 45075_4]KCZ20415.1 hypothetical protein K034_0296 [Acinetobacter baumannii 42057_3]
MNIFELIRKQGLTITQVCIDNSLGQSRHWIANYIRAQMNL